MKLFDGSGEFRSADSLKEGDHIRCPDGKFRDLFQLVHDRGLPQGYVGIACTDGFGFEIPGTSRVLVKFDG